MDKERLTEKIRNLNTWLYFGSGLNMREIIDRILKENYETTLTNKEVEKFYSDLRILRLTDYPDIDGALVNKLPNGIEKAALVKKYEKWCSVNKLNTSHKDLSDLLVYLIGQLIQDDEEENSNYGKYIYSKIMENPIDGLLLFKPKIEEYIKYYFIEYGNGLDDFIRFTVHIQQHSRKGEKAEAKLKNYFLNHGFEIMFQGGDGNFIDMKFGCDMIIFREDIGYKSIQIKSYDIEKEKVKYYDVNWLGIYLEETETIIVKDIKTFEILDLTSKSI